MNNIIEGIRAYFLDCPLLDESGKIGVDFLGDEAVEYVIESVPCEPVIKRYMDGGTQRQYLFVFASREAHGSDALDNMVNCGFYEAFADWLEAQDRDSIYPQLPEGKTPIGIKAITCGYLFDAGPDTGRYQIQCRLIYNQEG